MLKQIIATGAVRMLSGCWLARSTPEPAAETAAVNSLELFISRSSLGMTEFEQYKIQNGLFFQECGKRTHGRYYPLHEDVRTLESEERTALGAPVAKVARAIQQPTADFPPA